MPCAKFRLYVMSTVLKRCAELYSVMFKAHGTGSVPIAMFFEYLKYVKNRERKNTNNFPSCRSVFQDYLLPEAILNR
jgi:hypothetical protein